MTVSGARALAAALAVVLVSMPGCRKKADLPRTYPVRGEVLYQGGQPMKGGLVQLRSSGDTRSTVVGDISADGTFTLFTLQGNQRIAGAPEGDYEVSLFPPVPLDRTPVASITHKQSFHVGPGENHLRIELPMATLPYSR